MVMHGKTSDADVVFAGCTYMMYCEDRHNSHESVEFCQAAAAKEKMTKMRQSLAAKRRAKGIGEPGEEVTQSTAETVTSNTTEETAAQRKQRLKRQLGARVKERVSTTNAARGPDG